MSQDKLKFRKDLEYKILKTAEKDNKFRQKLIDNPKELASEMGLKLPKEINLKVIQEKKGEKILIIPEFQEQDELSDLQMVRAAGGTSQNEAEEKIKNIGRAISGQTR